MISLDEALKQSGLRSTQPRQAIFEYLQQHDRSTLSGIISSQPQIDRASVYRTINLFQRLGIIQHTVSGERRLIELTDRFDTHHHHLTCTACSHSVLIENSTVEQLITSLARTHAFTASSHQLEITGLCAKCQENQ